jgi:phosphohistidine swiveling domain-containing protein
VADGEPLALGGPRALHVDSHGLKAQGLDQALRRGLRVPAGFVLSTELAPAVGHAEPGAVALLEQALSALRATAATSGAASTLAVRASPTRSLPGALLTRLDVADDVESVVRAVADVLASASTPAVHEELAAEGVGSPERPWVAVLVQRQLRFDAGDFGAVVFTHDTHSGAPRLHGEYAAQGVVDVVSGRTQPRALSGGAGAPTLAAERPAAWEAIAGFSQRVAGEFDQPLELELGFCAGTPWLLQARALTFAARALVRLALSAIDEDSPRYMDYVRELARRGLDSLAEQHFLDTDASLVPLLRGVAASPGAAQGVLVTDVARAQERARSEPVVLVRPDAVPEDVAAFRRAAAVVTSSGGLTCHAAVIARGLGIPAVVGVGGVRIDVARGVVWGGRDGREAIAREGDWLSVDARRGLIYRGRLALHPRIHDAELARLFAELRKLRPAPLWVMGPAAEALRLKREASLDGALCTQPAETAPPTPEGRECWLEIDVAEIASRLPALQPGWGVVLRGALAAVSVAALRQRYPLRAWGMRFERPDDLTSVVPDAPIDLAVLGGDQRAAGPNLEAFSDTSLQKRVRAARLLHVMNFSGELAVPEETNVGWVCPVSTAALTALGYACQRTRHGRAAPGVDPD